MDTTTTTVEWEQSAECGELFAALAKAQGEIESAAKAKANPFFKSKYADLAAVWDACREPLSKNGLCVIQQPLTRGALVGLRTQLGHASGQWVACIATAESKDRGPQAYGSVVTYLRRYALQAFAGVASEDDDGEKAEGRDKNAKPPGASWGKPKNETKTDIPGDTGEVIDPGTLQDVRLAAGEKFRGKPAEAKKWLKDNFGSESAADLTMEQGKKALELLKAA